MIAFLCTAIVACGGVQSAEPKANTQYLELPRYLAEAPSATTTTKTPPKVRNVVRPLPSDPLPLRDSEIVLTEPILFRVGETTLVTVSESALEKVRMTLANHPEITMLHIEVHTDDRGAEPWNVTLSAGRAGTIARWLVAHGIDCRRLAPLGFGSAHPIASNASEEGRMQNRRTRLFVAEIGGRSTGARLSGGQTGPDHCVKP